MFLKIIILLMMALNVFAQYTPSADAYALAALIPYLNATNFLFDGPAFVSNAPTTPTTNLKPTVEQMMYYNYYCASMYCQYQLSDLSCEYCKKFKNDVKMQKVIIDSSQDVTAMVTLSTTRKEIVVTYRGGQNEWNAILALTMITVCYEGKACNIKLHAGFYTCAMALYDAVVTNVGYLKTLYPNYKIVITGHSLGAAMARITTFFILYLNQFSQFPNTKYELYTYGEPRVGNQAFVDFMNNQIITTARVVARADLVPHVVTPTSIVGTTILGDYYIHCQTEFWIDGEDGQRFADQSVYEDPTCSNSMGPAYSVLDHFLYFDVYSLICWLNEPQVWLAIPGGILQPIGTIPPLPQPISNFLGAALGFVSYWLGPLLGR